MRDTIKYKKGYPYPLGARKTDKGIQFCTVVPFGKNVNLCLYKGKEKKPVCVIPVTEELMYGSVASIFVEGINPVDYQYCYETDGIEEADKYAVRIDGMGKFGVNTDFRNVRCGFLNEFDWEYDKNPRIPLEKVILYRMHVRGFTKHGSSGAKDKGTFNGIKEKIPYLKELGINQIELMPVYEFIDTVPAKDDYKLRQDEPAYKCNYWGYSENNRYFCVKSAYAKGMDASTELKELIKELHKNDIEIIPEFYFAKNTEIEFVLNCLKFWVYEYHVDGFHLSGSVPYIEIITKDDLLSDVKIYSEYFNLDEKYERDKNSYNSRRLAISTESYKQAARSFLKSDMGISGQFAGLMRRDDEFFSCINYITGHDGFTMHDMVSYEYKHNQSNEEDNLDGTDYNISWNCGCEGNTRKNKIIELRKRQMKNAWVMMLFSKGIPAIWAGDEFCNSQNGNNNAYCQDNAVGWVNWKPPKAYAFMFEFVKTLIKIRKEYNIFWTTNENMPADSSKEKYPLISFHGEKAWNVEFSSGKRYFAVMYYVKLTDNRHTDISKNKGRKKNTAEKVKALYIAYNMNWVSQQFALPKLPGKMKWYSVVDTSVDEISTGFANPVEQFITVRERSCVIIMAM